MNNTILRKTSEASQPADRLNYIDAAKGIGIILVVFAHMLINNQDWISDRIFNYIYVFHMPLFFLLSGTLFARNREHDEVVFVRKRIKSLLLPYVIFSLLSLLLFLPQVHRAVPVMQEMVLGQRQRLPFNEALWFLPALFVIEVAFFFATKWIKNNFLICFLSFLISYIGFPHVSRPSLPWSIDAAAYYAIYFCIGYLISLRLQKLSSVGKGRFTILTFLFLIVYIIAARAADDFVDPYAVSSVFYIDRYLVFFVGAIGGTALSLMIAYMLQNYRPLLQVGKNSLAILGLHLPIRFLVIQPIIIAMHFSINVEHNNLGLFYFILTSVLLYPSVILFNRFMRLFA